MKGFCPPLAGGCGQHEVVTSVHPDTTVVVGDQIYRIPEEHKVCLNCDWNTCGFD